MMLTIKKTALLKPLQLVSGTLERRQTTPILSNVLLSVVDKQLSITATDREIEITVKANITTLASFSDITVSGKKLLDIVRAIFEQATVDLVQQNGRLLLTSGHSRFNLSTLPAKDFPNIGDINVNGELMLPKKALKFLLTKTYCAMATQDVRYYLNGLLFSIDQDWIVTVASDGHRLALAKVKNTFLNEELSIIVPRKGVLELMRLLQDNDDDITLKFSDNVIRAQTHSFTFTSKLIKGSYPNYHRLVPKDAKNIALIAIKELQPALLRVAILANQKHYGVRFCFSHNLLKIFANNYEQEEAKEELEIDYQGVEIELGFNVNYLLDIASNMPQNGQVKIMLTNADSSVLLQPMPYEDYLYVVMPMRL